MSLTLKLNVDSPTRGLSSQISSSNSPQHSPGNNKLRSASQGFRPTQRGRSNSFDSPATAPHRLESPSGFGSPQSGGCANDITALNPAASALAASPARPRFLFSNAFFRTFVAGIALLSAFSLGTVNIVNTETGRRWITSGMHEIMQASRDVAAAVVYTVTVHPRKLTNSSSGLRGGGGNATVDNSRRMLIAVTTCNNAWLVDRFLELSERPPFVDYVIIDDYSQDDVAAVAEKHGVRHVRTLFPRGLTYGWNIAYKLFRNEGYEFLVISNNDVVIPRGAMASMQAAMREHPEFSIVGPLTHPRGLGGRRSRVSANVTEHFYNDQLLKTYHSYLPAPLLRKSVSVEEAQKIQDIIGVHTFADPLPMVVKAKRYPLGFFLGFTRGVIAKELPGGRILPSTSYYIILHQEEYFRRRYPMGVVPRAYVHHDKAATVPQNVTGAVRNSLSVCHSEQTLLAAAAAESAANAAAGASSPKGSGSGSSSFSIPGLRTHSSSSSAHSSSSGRGGQSQQGGGSGGGSNSNRNNRRRRSK